MPLTITDIRAKYPQYAGLSDEDLAKRLYDKLYAGKLDWNAYRSQVMPAPAAPAAVAPTTIESPDDATGLTPTEEPDTADNLIGLAKRSAARVLGAGATLGEQGLRKITTGVADRAGLSDSDRQILKALSPVGSLESGLSTVRGAAEKYEADVVAALSPDVRRSIELQFIERDEEGRLRFGEGATDKWWWTAQTIDLGAMMTPGIGTSAVAARMAYGSRYAQVLTELGSKKIATSVAIKEAEKQALEAAAKAGVIAGGLAEGTLAGGFNARQVEETIAQIDEPTMMNYAPYRALRDKGMTHEEARSRIATDQGFAAGISTAVVTGLTGAPLNALMGRWLAGGAVGKTRAGAAGKVLTGEMAQEFVQEGSEAAIANIAERPITGKDTWEGVLEQAITGAAVAVVPGAAGGVVAGVRVPAPKGKGEDTPPPDPTPGLRARADALEKSRAQLKSVLEDASNPNIAITQQDIEEARDAYRGTLVEYAQELIRSGQLNDENQQAVANALRDAQRAGRELPASPVPGVIRDNVKKPVSPTAQAGDEKAAGQKKAEPAAEEVPEGLNEVETARYDALQRVATADTLDAAQLTELTAEGLARTNREGRPLLTPEGRRQRKALADRMAAAETAQAEAEKQQVAKKPQKAKKPVEPAVEKAPEVPVATTQQVLKPYRLKRARESLRAPDFDALERVRARAAIDEDEATPLLRAGLIQKTDDGYWIKPRGRRELRDYNITGKVPVERAPTPREPLTLDASRRQAAEARRTAPPTPEQAAAQKEAAFQQRAQLKTTEERRAAIQKERDRRAALNQVGDQTIEQAPYTVQEPATTPLADTLRQAMERGEPLPVTASEAPAPPARPATEIAPQAPAFVGRKRQPDAVSIVGVHYSKQPGLSKLDPRRAGTGSAGGERRRFGPGQYGTSGDPYGRRIYFYQQTDENLPAKETAVSGQIPYRVRLDNLYDASADPKGFRADAGPNADLFEELVSDAGYDGFVTDPPAGIDAPVAVVFNVAKQIPVEDVSAQPADTAASEAPTDGGLQVMEVVGGQTERGPLLAPNGKRSKLGPAQYAMVRTPEFKKWFGDWEKFALMPGNVWNDADGEVSKVVDPETGEPLEVYHGTTEGGYDVFEQSQSRRGISATFFTASYRTARSYSGTGTEVDLEAPEAPPDGYRVEQQEDGTWAYFWSDSATPDRLGFESYEEAIAELWAQEDKNGVPGIYSVFLNIRDPLEEDFDGANWDGNRQGGYEVVNEEGETQYDDQGRGFFADRDDAYRLAFKTGGDVIPAGDLPFTTDDVVSQAKRAGSTDGAIMRNVVDEGPFSGYWDTTDVFAVFKPEQVKSSTQNVGTFDPTDPRITASEAQDQTQSQEFRIWFGESKVTGEAGEPLVVYHGTASVFDSFDPSRRPDRRTLLAKTHDIASAAGWVTPRGAFKKDTLDAEIFGNRFETAEQLYGGPLPPLDALDAGAMFFTDNTALASQYAEASTAGTGGYKGGDAASVLPVYLQIQRPVVLDFTETKSLIVTLPDGSRHDLGNKPIGSWVHANRIGLAFAKKFGADGIISRRVNDSPIPRAPHERFKPHPADNATIYTVFKPEQIKSAIGNRGTFSPMDPRIVAAEAPQAPVFYSALIRAISAAKIAKGTGEQWLGMLRNIAGVKPEEIEYYDLAEWLGDRKGVTREEIIDYLRANELQIQEIKYEEQTLNVASPYWGPEVDRVLSDHPGYAPDALEIKLANDEAAYEEVTKKHPELAYDEEWYKVVLGSVFPPGRGVASLPRYNKPGLITPGGMQYQEMLFQIPTERTKLEAQLARLKNEMRAITARGEIYPDELNAEAAALRKKLGEVPITREYDSPHWTPGNVVAHVRYNIRVGADGARTLILEEVQSDWHQEGRKKGYSGSEKPGPLGEPPGYTLHNETQEARDAGMDIPPTAPEIWLYTDPDGNYSRRYASALDALAAARGNYDFRNSVRGGARVPDAPFKTTWPMLVMKRMMRYAADNGIDKVAWTTGAQQADRYSLRVVADTLSGMWEPKKDQPGTYRIWVTASNRAGHVQVVPEMSSPAELEATVGKELATKILAQSPGDYVKYGGVDLDIGGAGMRSFYDKELVNETNKLLKKYGAKVRTDYIGDMAFGVYDRGPHAAYRWQVVSRDKRIPSGTPFASRTEAQAEADRRNKESKDKGVLPAHAFDITPKLRDGVRGGLPLFASGWTATGSTPAGINWRMLRGVVERVESELGVRANFAMVKAALPGYLQSYAKNRRPQGLFYNNPAGGPEVWLIGEYLADEKTAYETAMHEIVGHMGLRALLGKDYARTMDRIIASFPDVVRAAAARNRIPLNAADARKYGMDPAKLDDPVVRRAMQRLAAEEMVAYTAGSMLTKRGAKSDLNLLSRIVSAVRAVLRRMGLLNKFTETDIYNLIYRARDHVTRKPAKVHVREAKHDSDVAAAKKRAPAAEYAPRSTIDDGPLLGMPDGADLPAGRRGSAQPFKTARTAAQAYKRKYGIATPDVRTYAKTDPVTARRVADAFESMPHTPNDPKVRDAYAALAREVLAQYQFIKDTGLKVEFMRPGEDPYAGELRQMMDDVRFNNHIWVYPTEEGFGENTDQYSQGHPMLAPTDEYAGNKRMVLNDVFRIVHDYFGHVQEGNGFTFTGEENAWRIHATMFTDAALPALASETRGQASWVRYGPKEKENRGAPVADVHYAPQKAGLLPEEFWYPTPEERPEVLAAEAAEEPSEQPAVPPLELARTARAELLEKGGFTVDPRTGAAPTEGWAVSLDKAAEKVFDKAPTAAQLAAYVRKNAEALETGYFGGWRRGDGKFVLDVITVMPEADRDAVVEAGQLAEQDAVYNLRTGEEVPLPKLSSSKLRARRAIQQVAGLLTPAERAKLTQASAERLIEKMKELPSAQDMAAAALAGQSKRGWYRDAAETIVNIFGPDAPRFAALLGATSPRATVAENLTAALRIWTGWVSEGRPTDEAAIVDIMRRRSRVFGAWKNNVIATLQAEDPGSLVLSGPKANSFADNLRGVVNEVTLDGWMAVFAAVDQKEWFGGARNISGTDPGKGTGYLAYAARVRETAKYLTELTGDEWTPAEVQETIWSWAKALTEAAESAKRSPAGIIANGELTDEIINATPDFATLFAGPEHEAILRGAGYGKQLDRAIRAQTDRAGARRQAFPPAEGDRQRLIDRASRIEAYRAGSAVEDVPFSVLGGNTGNDALDRFTAKIGGPRRTLKQMWRDLTEGLLERANAAVFDDLYGIKRAGDLAGISAADVGFKNAHLSRSAAELTQAVIEYGPPVWHRDGGHVVAGIDGDMGLVRILRPLGDNVNLWLTYMVAKRADRLMGEGRENLFSQDEIDAALDLGRLHPEFDVVAAEYANLQKKVLDFAEEAGVIDPDARAMWEHADYIPFYRVIENGVVGPNAGGALGKVRNQIRRLRGGAENLGDPLDNIVRNWHSLFDASLKAQAARTVVDALDGTGLVSRAPQVEITSAIVPAAEVAKFIRQNPILVQTLTAVGLDPARLPPEAFVGLQKMLAVQAPTDEDIISVWRNGKREYWHAHDEMLYASLMNIHRASWGPLMEILRFPKRLVTATITSTPQFGVKNFWRDMWHAFVQGAVGNATTIIPGLDSARGAIEQFREGPNMRALLAGGGSFTHGYIRAGDTAGAAASIRRSLRKISPSEIVLDSPAKVWRFYRDLLNAAENSHRVSMYLRMQETGASRLDAMYEARDLLDFAKRGNNAVIRFLIESVPFLNARMQGLHRLARGPDGNKAVFTAIAMRGLLLTAATVAIVARYHDDERYKELTDAQKTMYWHFFDVLEEGDHWALPKPFEVGTIFGTLPEALLDALITNAEEPDAAKQSLKLVGHAFGEALSLKPEVQAVWPLVELAINRNTFTGAPVLTMGDEAVLPEDQDSPRTSPTYRMLARAMPEFAPDALRSPKQLEHLGRGYLGNIQDYVLLATDSMARWASGEPTPPERATTDIPGLRDFRKTGPSRHTKYVDAMYTIADEAAKVDASIRRATKAATEQGDARALELETEFAPLLDVRKDFVDAVGTVNELRREQREVQLDPDMTADAKRKLIDEIQVEINEVARGVWDLRPGGRLNPEVSIELIGAAPEEQRRLLQASGMTATAELLESVQ